MQNDSIWRRYLHFPLPNFRLLVVTVLVCAHVGCTWAESNGDQPHPTIITDAPPPAAFDNVEALNAAQVPERDLVDLAQRLGGRSNIPRVVPNRASPDLSLPAGHFNDFWYKNHETNQSEQIRARLIYQSEQLNLWLEDGANVDETTVKEAARVLEDEIIPTNRAFFGHEWQPGVDGDPRLNILHIRHIGGNVLGYFSAADEYVTAVNPYSNQREIFYVSIDHAPIGSEAYYQVIAHEMQHMIHWHQDGNETTWLDEGMSVLASALNGYREVGFDAAFAEQTDVQLNRFDYESAMSAANYGAAFLFSAYYLDRFGNEATQALLQRTENGEQGIEAALRELGQPMAFEALFGDWATATYLDSLGRAEGVYQYRDLEVPEITPSASHNRFPVSEKATVHQYGVDYIRLRSSQPLSVTFTGSRQIQLLATTAHSGNYMWSTVPADDSDMTLTAPFDLSALHTATLTFWSWYDIEAGWDYAYAMVSQDEGQSWHLLETEYTTKDNPQGNSYGPALTGTSGDGETVEWVQQTADLSPYAGGRILLRIEYITDDAVHRPGLALDDIRIPELNYADDVEAGTGRWQAHGFVRHSNLLPQTFAVQAILLGKETARIEPLPLDESQQGRWTLPLDRATNEAILVIIGTVPVTNLKASYDYEIREAFGSN